MLTFTNDRSIMNTSIFQEQVMQYASVIILLVIIGILMNVHFGVSKN